MPYELHKSTACKGFAVFKLIAVDLRIMEAAHKWVARWVAAHK
jgi:hypothetical protein